MAEEPLPNNRNQWLWFIMIASMALLLLAWLVTNWHVSSDVKVGADASGLSFPANGGLEVSGKRADQPATANQ